MKYISCFSGIGGLEGNQPPLAFCEMDHECHKVLHKKYPGVEIHKNIETFKPPKAHLVAGGWPCQDISIAGNQAGLSGNRSKLLHELVRVAKESGAQVVLAENVANILRMDEGREFSQTLKIIHQAGFSFVSWRVVNARHFGLPQHRTRLLLIAAHDKKHALSIFRPTPEIPKKALDDKKRMQAAGFYWTAGTHSINYSQGYCPTVKIGSSINIPSPPAVHFSNSVRLLSPIEALRLQGFNDFQEDLSNSTLYRMAGNAVPRPMGLWLFEGIENQDNSNIDSNYEIVPRQQTFFNDNGCETYSSSGISTNNKVQFVYSKETKKKAINLIDFLDKSDQSCLSPRAASGLLNRLSRSGQPCPENLRALLESCAVANGAKDA